MLGRTRYSFTDAKPQFKVGAWNFDTKIFVIPGNSRVAIAERGNPSLPQTFQYLVIKYASGDSAYMGNSTVDNTTGHFFDGNDQQIPVYISCASPGLWVWAESGGVILSVIYYKATE